jgi:hypothetical protein
MEEHRVSLYVCERESCDARRSALFTWLGLLDHLMISETATRLHSFLDNLNWLDEKGMHVLNRERLAELLLGQYLVPQSYHSLLLADLCKAEPEALRCGGRCIFKRPVWV